MESRGLLNYYRNFDSTAFVDFISHPDTREKSNYKFYKIPNLWLAAATIKPRLHLVSWHLVSLECSLWLVEALIVPDVATLSHLLSLLIHRVLVRISLHLLAVVLLMVLSLVVVVPITTVISVIPPVLMISVVLLVAFL